MMNVDTHKYRLDTEKVKILVLIRNNFSNKKTMLKEANINNQKYFQKVKSYADTNVNESILVNEHDIYGRIKTGGREKDLIIQARYHGKGSSEYDSNKIKISSVLWYAHFNNYKSTENLKSLTNFIYCDIDSVENTNEIKERLKKYPFIRAVWRSFGGEGIGFTVMVNDVNVHSLKTIYRYISDQINIPLDNNVPKITQANVLSYDPSIYINPSPVILNVPEDLIIDKNLQNVSLAFSIIKEVYRQANEPFLSRINFKTQLSSEEFNGEDYVVFEDGRDFVLVYISKNGIKEGVRHTSLISITNKLIFNSPDAYFQDLMSVIKTINIHHCYPPLPENEIIKIVTWSWDNYNEGRFNIKTKRKYIWFNPDCALLPKDKMSIAAKYTAKRRFNKTDKKIDECISTLYNEGIHITIKKVHEFTAISVATIKRHWKNFKDDVKIMNDDISRWSD